MTARRGRPPHRSRIAIIRDLDNLDLSAAEISARNNAARSTVSKVAEDSGVDMNLRRRIIVAKKQKAVLEERIRDLTRRYRGER